MKFEIEITNTENIKGMTESDKRQMTEIVSALLSTGSFSGVRGGQVLIHFDHNGIFQKVQHSYFPWVRRSVDKR